MTDSQLPATPADPVPDVPEMADVTDVPEMADPADTPVPEMAGVTDTPDTPDLAEMADPADPVMAPAGSGPRPAEAAPADATLVPLEELAPAITSASTSRRAFLGFGLAITGGVMGAAIIARFTPVFAEEPSTATPIVPTYDPASKQWAYVVDTAACIGCGLCVSACKEENHVPEEPEYTRTWIERHTTTTDGALYIDSPDGGIDGFPPESTAPGAAGKPVESSFFMPRLCMQCANSPCTEVCPVGATYRTVDGVILVDARRCIGCGYCVVACPYGARYLVPAGEHAPNDTPGVADKCTWCYHRISRNLQPVCVEVCPVGARKFGDAADPDSEMAQLIAETDPQPYWPEYGTEPVVLYLGPVNDEA